MPQRIYEWDDVDPKQDFLARMSGLDYCRAVMEGRFPVSPIFRTMGVEFESVADGLAVLSLETHAYLMHGRAIMNGGAIATLLDTAMSWAALSTLERGSGFTTVHLGVDFVRPAPAGSGHLRAEGRVLNRGRRTVLLDARVTNEQGKLIASGNSTCLIFDLDGSAG